MCCAVSVDYMWCCFCCVAVSVDYMWCYFCCVVLRELVLRVASAVLLVVPLLCDEVGVGGASVLLC